MSQQPTPSSTVAQVSGPPLDELLALAVLVVLVVPLEEDDEADVVEPPPRHSTLQLACRHCPSAPRDTLLLQDAGGLVLAVPAAQAAARGTRMTTERV